MALQQFPATNGFDIAESARERRESATSVPKPDDSHSSDYSSGNGIRGGTKTISANRLRLSVFRTVVCCFAILSPSIDRSHCATTRKRPVRISTLLWILSCLNLRWKSGEITASAYLVVSSSGSWCDIHVLKHSKSTTIGRGGDNQIVLHSNKCSRRHCEVFSRNRDWYVRDFGSRNGTRLNDEPLTKVKPLNLGDRLEIAGTVFLLTTSISDIEGASLDVSCVDSDTVTALENTIRQPDTGSSPDDPHSRNAGKSD